MTPIFDRMDVTIAFFDEKGLRECVSSKVEVRNKISSKEVCEKKRSNKISSKKIS